MSKNDPKKHGSHVSKSEYAAAIVPLQVELERVARWLEQTGQRLLVILEGRDTAGKGGTIAAIAERLNPRKCRVAALGTPSEREATQWYFQRYVEHLPAGGEIVLFDRSWYNRAGVEAVMNFCTPAQTTAFLKQAPRFERMLVDDGILLFKYWLTVDQAEQEKRFADRLHDPLKRWKLSPIDLEARKHYADYGRARDRMLAATHTRYAPWTLVDFNDQKRGRLALIRDLIDRLPARDVKNGALELPPLDTPPQRERFSDGWKPL
jgi:polyphosphate kinase 2